MNKLVDKLLPLKLNDLHILSVLRIKGELHGYAIMKEVKALTEGKASLKVATLYRSLDKLLEQELIQEVETGENEDERRRNYKLTTFGEEVLQAEINRLEGLLSKVTDFSYKF
jgi:DNA-binding PadR family transcriptional regulator